MTCYLQAATALSTGAGTEMIEASSLSIELCLRKPGKEIIKNHESLWVVEVLVWHRLFLCVWVMCAVDVVRTLHIATIGPHT